MSDLLIAGCGTVGCELARQLVAAGHAVVALRRHPETADDLPDAVRRVAADLTDPATLTDLPPVDGVAYTASPNDRSEDAYRACYVDGLRHLIGALQPHRERLRRFVLTSSTGVYGQQDGSVVTDETPAEPESPTGRIILEGEQLLREQLPDAGIVLRLAGIYGPGRLVHRLVNQVVDGTVAYDEGETGYLNLIHRDDAAGALAHLLTMPDDPPKVLIGVDREPAERRALYSFIADQLDLPLPPPGRAAPRNRNKQCSGERLPATGYRFRYPTFRDGMPELIEDPADTYDGE